MDIAAYMTRLRAHRHYSDQIVRVQSLPERPPRYGEVADGLAPAVSQALSEGGVKRLYLHQASAIEAIREGRHVVIVTGTASGKTLCYTIPVVERLIADPSATMLHLFPTKALTQDQLRGLSRFHRPQDGIRFLAGTYDGDTPQNLRRKLRDGANVILTNPDMLHQGILPQHPRWNRFFTHLQYVVIDEIHAYRGVFGSHIANVMRRLHRICDHYGASPRFICCSATIANPGEHAGRITGEEMTVIDDDGSPRGPKQFVLWNPPIIESSATGESGSAQVGGDRRSSLWEAVELMTGLVREGVQTIVFVRTRLASEMVFRNSRELLQRVSGRLANSVHAYRGGYLPEERREIERRLAEKDLLGVASTNALELGIDIGSLDACILVGYPGTIASMWQQAGRAGRGHDEALVILVAQNSPIDQYLMSDSRYLFAKSPEQAVVDPDNPYIVLGHLKAASNELPIRDEEVSRFGPFAETILEMVEEEQQMRHIDGRWYWADPGFPAAEVNLRNIAGPVYTIQDETEGVRIIGTMDEVSAISQLHTHAVYLHGAETYFVNRLDFEQKIARVEKRDLDYYTQSIQVADIRIDQTDTETEWRGSILAFGDVTVTTTIPMFKKIKFHSRESLGFEKLELPPQSLETVALWFAPPPEMALMLVEQQLLMGEALIGIANVTVEIAPMFVMCDPSDIGATVGVGCLGRDAIFLYDRYPGGMGYARRCLERFAEMMRTVHRVIRECACQTGCPSCVGSPITAFTLTDLDGATRGRIPNKNAALCLLNLLLGEEVS